MFYRADLAKSAGLTESDLNGSWESFIESAKKLKANGDIRIIAHARDVKDIRDQDWHPARLRYLL